MEKQSSPSSISVDSLEADRKKTTKAARSDENVDTILVPFYENDVLMKVPKGQKNRNEGNKKENLRKAPILPNYLVNKSKPKRTSYLEIFRKQFTCEPEKNTDEYEISSVMPEFGDTEQESIGEEASHPDKDFYETEAYNDEFYDKLLQEENEYYLNHYFEEDLRFVDNICKEDVEKADINLRSLSEISQRIRPSRRTTAPHMPNVNIGGLGPDTEKIRPRLERARSLQRYSEKVRMENRLRIYKQSLNVENDKKSVRGVSPNVRNPPKEKKLSKDSPVDSNNSYLVNKSQELKEPKPTIFVKTYNEAKSKSAGIIRGKDKKNKEKPLNEKMAPKKFENNIHEKKVVDGKRYGHGKNNKKGVDKCEDKNSKEISRVRVKSSAVCKSIHTEINAFGDDPVQISFLVNVGGARPSTALRSLEEKHRMYQERVKTFTTNNNNI